MTKHARVLVTRFGGPEVLEVIEEPPPEPKRGEVRLRMVAAGVALPDLLMREGVHPEARRPPFTPGWDLVGVVDRVGAGVAGIEPGSTIAGLPVRGAHAAYVCLGARDLVPVPQGLDGAEAVALVLNYVTALQMLQRIAHVGPGDRVLVHGAAGAVGTALLQLVPARLGAPVRPATPTGDRAAGGAPLAAGRGAASPRAAGPGRPGRQGGLGR